MFNSVKFYCLIVLVSDALINQIVPVVWYLMPHLLIQYLLEQDDTVLFFTVILSDVHWRFHVPGGICYSDISIHRADHFFLPWHHIERSIGWACSHVLPKGEFDSYNHALPASQCASMQGYSFLTGSHPQ